MYVDLYNLLDGDIANYQYNYIRSESTLFICSKCSAIGKRRMSNTLQIEVVANV